MKELIQTLYNFNSISNKDIRKNIQNYIKELFKGNIKNFIFKIEINKLDEQIKIILLENYNNYYTDNKFLRDKTIKIFFKKLFINLLKNNFNLVKNLIFVNKNFLLNKLEIELNIFFEYNYNKDNFIFIDNEIKFILNNFQNKDWYNFLENIKNINLKIKLLKELSKYNYLDKYIDSLGNETIYIYSIFKNIKFFKNTNNFFNFLNKNVEIFPIDDLLNFIKNNTYNFSINKIFAKKLLEYIVFKNNFIEKSFFSPKIIENNTSFLLNYFLENTNLIIEKKGLNKVYEIVFEYIISNNFISNEIYTIFHNKTLIEIIIKNYFQNFEEYIILLLTNQKAKNFSTIFLRKILNNIIYYRNNFSNKLDKLAINLYFKYTYYKIAKKYNNKFNKYNEKYWPISCNFFYFIYFLYIKLLRNK